MSNSTNTPGSDDAIDVFLVEDNPGDVRLIREALETIDSDVNLEVVTNGDEAVETFLHSEGDESHPDMVLLDLNLPGRDGCAVLDAIREDEDLQALPVLVLSSSSDSADVARCYESKANAYLTKPGNLTELSSMMATLEEFWFENVRLPTVST